MLGRRMRSVLSARVAGLPASDALLLLPETPRTAAVLGGGRRWRPALASWGIREAPERAADLVVGRPPAVLADGARPAWVLAPGTDRAGRLRRAGYAVTTYQVRWLSWHVVTAAADRRVLALARTTWPAEEGTSAGIRGVVARVLRPKAVTVAVREGTPEPGAPAAAGFAGRGACLTVDVENDRRRAVFLVPEAGTDRPRAVVKVQRGPGTEDRSAREQRVLASLPPGSATPRPLGAGHAGAVRWSAETAVSGRPLHRVLTRPHEPVRDVLDRLAEWLGDVATATAAPTDWTTTGIDDGVIALRGPAADLRPLLRELAGVPSVLTHGDLAGGRNVLVDAAARPWVLDWETARERGLPLLDLLPLLCSSLARASGADGPQRQAAYVLDLAAGRLPESAWLFDRVFRYADRTELPRRRIGRLALLAWGSEASLRPVHDELRTAAGLPVRPWTSLGECVLPRWRNELGPNWRSRA